MILNSSELISSLKMEDLKKIPQLKKNLIEKSLSTEDIISIINLLIALENSVQ